jgi:hypothetical protein
MATTDDDALAGRKRKLEEDYFRKQDQELIERMRRAAILAQERDALEAKTGLHDPELLKDLQGLGFHPDTVVLLPLVPLVQVAWVEGGVSPQERALIVDLARKRGVQQGSAADRQLAEWLSESPDSSVFTRAARLIRAMLDAGSQETRDLSPDDLVKYCENIAAASGGLLGIGRVSSEERALLKRIAEQLKAR